MKLHDELSDTKEMKIPAEPQGENAAPVQRASMHRKGENSEPPRRPPEAPVRRAPERTGNQKKKKRRKKQKESRFGKRLALVLCTLVLLLFVLYSAVAWVAIRRLRKDDPAPRNITANAVFEDSAVRNILLIGTDSRGEERGRADTIMLLSLSRRNQTVTVTSLLRDSYVSIPGYGTDKLNAAYSYGGATLLMDTIVNNFNIRVDDYFCIGFAGFVHLVDALGGTDIALSEREVQAVNEILHSEVNGIMGDPDDADYLTGSGMLHLDGKQTLSYSRIRYIGNADFERTERQRTVLTQLLGNVKHIRYDGIAKILSDVMPEIATSYSDLSLYGLALSVPPKMLIYNTQTLRLPADGTYSNQYADNGAMVLAVDFDANLQLFRDAVTEKPEKPAQAGEEAP